MRVGSEFVGYRIDELIGRGGMGVVYRAYDLRLKRTVALKLMAPELALDQRFRERFSREAELAMSLEHPNVVPIHDAADIDGRLYLAMRHVEGGDLKSLLHREGPLDPARALAICRQAANALDAAHANGLVHRDVKPSNVLLGAGEHVYLADFGLTRRLDEEGGPPGEGRSVGTPAYLAPEQLEGGPVDGRTDVYSLGCLLYECLTGEAPFAGGSRLAVAWAHLEEEPPSVSARRPDLPEAIDAVIRKAMAKQPEDRYPTCSALVTAGEEALGFRRVPLLRRPRGLLLVGVTLVAAIAAAVAAAVLAAGGHSKTTASLLGGENTLARIDPATNRVREVIGVGTKPAAVAIAGHTVWVYNQADWTISAYDARTNRVLEVTGVHWPARVSMFTGPVLAADASGAWLVNGGFGHRSLLINVLPRGRGTRDYRLDLNPNGVAAGEGSVWVVGRNTHGDEVLRIDPATGRVTARTRFPASARIDSIAVGFDAVWVVGSSPATLYRIDPRTAERAGQVVLGTSRPGRPEIMERLYDWRSGRGESVVSVRLAGGAGRTAQVDPSTVTITRVDACCQPDLGQDIEAFGSYWWDDWPTGTVSRQTGDGPVRTIHVAQSPPTAGGQCLTSMAIGAGGVWVTIASNDGANSCTE
jgi:Protein kinase domain